MHSCCGTVTAEEFEKEKKYYGIRSLSLPVIISALELGFIYALVALALFLELLHFKYRGIC